MQKMGIPFVTVCLYFNNDTSWSLTVNRDLGLYGEHLDFKSAETVWTSQLFVWRRGRAEGNTL
jgi:hypothetical protein